MFPAPKECIMTTIAHWTARAGSPAIPPRRSTATRRRRLLRHPVDHVATPVRDGEHLLRHRRRGPGVRQLLRPAAKAEASPPAQDAADDIHTGVGVHRGRRPGSRTAAMRAVVDELAHPRYGGRRVGSAGGRAAAEWLAGHLTALGATTSQHRFSPPSAVREVYAIPSLRWTDGDTTTTLTFRREFCEHLASADQPSVLSGRVARPGQAVDRAWVLDEAFSADRAASWARRRRARRSGSPQDRRARRYASSWPPSRTWRAQVHRPNRCAGILKDC